MQPTLEDGSLIKSQALINGRWSNSKDGGTFEVQDPATNRVIGMVARCGSEETQDAIDAASIALQKWRKTPAKERSELLLRWFELVISNKSDLAKLLTLEQGKPLSEALAEITYGASYIQWFAEESKRLNGDIIPGLNANQKILVTKEPVGVVAAITPWNFPNAMLTRKIAPALAAGCTIVCKPANLTPLSALALGELSLRAGIPAGVINILCGKTSEIGDKLCQSNAVRKLTFTGSTEVGRLLLEKCAPTVKRTSMELGGNAPFIVFGDADLDLAIDGLMASKFRNSGQTCVCTNRVLVDTKIEEDFTKKLRAKLDLLRLGAGMDEYTNLGPLVDQAAANGVRKLIARASEQGAIAEEMKWSSESQLSENFVPACILKNVTSEMEIFQEEIFGPVVPITIFKSDEEAIRLANATPFGLAAYFYTTSARRQWSVADDLEYGIIGINEGKISNEMAPFGGVKQSGFGREGSKYGLDDYVELKYRCLNTGT